MKLVVATHNEGKLVEIRRILEEDLGADAAQVELVSAGSLGLPDPVETGVTFQENALLKARFVAGLTGLPAIADDSGLIVDVMGNAPGILSARWAGSMAMIRRTTRCYSPSSPTSRTRRARPVSAAPPHWPCRIPRPLWRAGGTPSSPKPSKSAKCRGASCARRAASMVSATTRCSCRTTSRSGPLRTIR